MKKTHYIMAPLFAAVVVLLSIGAMGELFVSLLSKLKSILHLQSAESSTVTNVATQLK